MVDPLTDADIPAGKRVGDGLPETLEEVIDTYGHTYFKLTVGGDLQADLYRDFRGITSLRIDGGRLAIGSLGAPGFASAAMPRWQDMREMT